MKYIVLVNLLLNSLSTTTSPAGCKGGFVQIEKLDKEVILQGPLLVC